MSSRRPFSLASRERDDVPATAGLPDPVWRAVPFILPWLALLQVFHRYTQLSRPSVGLHPDVTSAWQPVAEAVFSGVPLYSPGATDNKPPLFEFINLAAYATDHYVLTFLLLVGLANGVVAVLIWQCCRQRGVHRIGLIAAVSFLGVLPAVDGLTINARTFAMVGVLAALVARRPVVRGVALAAGALCSQYALLALPLIALDGTRGRQSRARYQWLWRFGVATVATVATGFSVPGIIWGPAATADAVYWSVGRAPGYILERGPSVTTLPWAWVRLFLGMHVRLLGMLSFGVVGVVVGIRRTLRRHRWGLDQLALGLAGLLGLPLLVRPFPTYWLYPLPGIAILAALGLRSLIGR